MPGRRQGVRGWGGHAAGNKASLFWEQGPGRRHEIQTEKANWRGPQHSSPQPKGAQGIVQVFENSVFSSSSKTCSQDDRKRVQQFSWRERWETEPPAEGDGWRATEARPLRSGWWLGEGAGLSVLGVGWFNTSCNLR